MNASVFATTDIADEYGDAVYVVAPKFHSFGGVARFCGPVKTLLAFEDNTMNQF